MNWIHAVIILALIEYLVFCILVGRARAKYAIAAPAVTGNEMFERYFRVQQNTLEQLIVFIPAILLFARYTSVLWAGLLGVVFLLGRIIYAAGYISAPQRRGPGASISFLCEVVLILGALVGVVRSLMNS
jgi:glutathione S-transferase